MPIYLKQSTASQEIPLGYFVDSSDGDTEETGLTIANTDIKLWKAGATSLANKNSGGATHISNGIYYCVLDATDTNTLGTLIAFVHVSGALAVRVECVVLAANVYDSLIGGGDYLQTDAVQIEGSDATDQLDAHDGNPLDAAGIRTAIGLASANLDTQLDALPTAAENRAEMDSNSTQLAAIVADTNELQTDDVPGLIAALNDPTAAAIADAVWDEDIVAAHNTADTAGSLLDDLGTPSDFKADVSGLATAANLQTVDDNVDAILADTNELQTDDVPGLIAALNDPTAAAIADSVWEEAIADHSGTAGSTAEALNGANAPTAADVADAVWDEAISGHIAAGTTGAKLNSAASAGDPWSTAVPGSYEAGTAGYIIGNLETLGAGGTEWPVTINDGADPLDGVDVWITTDEAGANVVARGTTDANGEVTFYLDPGTYYAWKELAGYSFTNPEEMTVS